MTEFVRVPPVGDQERAELSVHALAIDHVHDYHLDMPGGSPDWVLIEFHDPCPVRWADGQVTTIPADHVVIWEPQSPTCYGATGRGVRHSWLRCRSRRLPAWLQAAGIACQLPLPVSDRQRTHGWWQLLRSELLAAGRSDAPVLVSLLPLFLQHVVAGVAADPPPLRRARQFIEQHWLQPLTLDQLARVAGWSRAHFAVRFKEHFGCGAIAYQRRLRMQQAQELLRATDLSVAAIAPRCGYDDPFQFSRAFKKECGWSPSAYRRER